MIVKRVTVGYPKPDMDLAVFLKRKSFVNKLKNALHVRVGADEYDGAITACRKAFC